MITEVLNNNLIEAMRIRIPDGTNLANVLMDILYIGKEAVYRRLRGGSSLHIGRSGSYIKKLGVSLDQIIGISSANTAMFNLNFLHYSEPLQTYSSMIRRYAEILETMSGDPKSVLSTASNMLPQAFYLKYDYLSRFRLFKWMYQHKQATYSYAGTENLEIGMIRIYSINSITSLDKAFCKSQKDWIKSLKRFSTNISVSGEIQRIQFFNTQREHIKEL